MKIYTKAGDEGKTSLWGGRQVNKADLQVEAYGNVDELNSFVGHLLVCSTMQDHVQRPVLIKVQRELFSIGAMLAQDPERSMKQNDFALADQAPEGLEHAIDELESDLTPLRHFILPGGSEAASRAHLCRTVCRRAERSVVLLHDHASIQPILLVYLNRLSDYFFVLARHLSMLDGAEDVIWEV